MLPWKIASLKVLLQHASLKEIKMSCSLYVKDLQAEITLEDLAIYFQSSSKSGGGDVDFDACKLDGNNAVIVFEKPECKWLYFQITLSDIVLRESLMIKVTL